MLTQHYKFQATPNHISQAKPGQFIFSEDGEDAIVGFIDFVSDCEVAVMLFTPRDLQNEPRATHISETCDFATRLEEIMDNDKEVADMWASLVELCEEQIPTEH